MQWVKASERLPKKDGLYHTRNIKDGKVKISVRSFSDKMNSKFYSNRETLEWLDESIHKIFYTDEISELLTLVYSNEITITDFVYTLNQKITGLTRNEQLKLNYGK